MFTGGTSPNSALAAALIRRPTRRSAPTTSESEGEAHAARGSSPRRSRPARPCARARRVRPSTWRGPAVAAQLAGQLDHLTERRRAERLALREQAPRRVDREPTAERRRALVDETALLAGCAEPELLVAEQLAGRVGVLALDDVEVAGPDARCGVGVLGGERRRRRDVACRRRRSSASPRRAPTREGATAAPRRRGAPRRSTPSPRPAGRPPPRPRSASTA